MLKYSESYPPHITLISDGVVRKNVQSNTEEYFLSSKELIEYFIENPHELVVSVSNFQFVIRKNLEYNPKSVSIIDSYQNNYHYSYDMKRLFILSEDERLIIDLYLRRYPTKKANDLRDQIEESYRDYPSLIEFCDKVKEWNTYQDRHSGNFLKDEYGNYLCIDIEGFKPIKEW